MGNPKDFIYSDAPKARQASWKLLRTARTIHPEPVCTGEASWVKIFDFTGRLP